MLVVNDTYDAADYNDNNIDHNGADDNTCLKHNDEEDVIPKRKLTTRHGYFLINPGMCCSLFITHQTANMTHVAA